MKKWQKWMISGLAAAGLAAASKGEICSTWEFPDNERALQEEYEASTNVTEVLTVGRTLDKEGVVVQFRKRAAVSEEAGAGTGNDGDFGVLVLNETAFLASARLIGASRGVGSGGQVVAWDQSQDDSYHDGVRYEEGDPLGAGGAGWKDAWSVPSVVSTKVLPVQDGYRGFLVENSSDQYASVTRQFASEMESGELTVSSLGLGTGEFWGFSLYGKAGEELFRWGALNLEPSEDHDGMYGFGYMLSEGDYQLASVDYPSGDVDYTLTWAKNGDGLDLWMGAKWTDDGPHTKPYDAVVTVYLANAVSVAGFGVTLSGRNLDGTPASLVFDYVEAKGTTTVPEPGTLALLAVGALGLARRRKGGANRAG